MSRFLYCCWHNACNVQLLCILVSANMSHDVSTVGAWNFERAGFDLLVRGISWTIFLLEYAFCLSRRFFFCTIVSHNSCTSGFERYFVYICSLIHKVIGWNIIFYTIFLLALSIYIHWNICKKKVRYHAWQQIINDNSIDGRLNYTLVGMLCLNNFCTPHWLIRIIKIRLRLVFTKLKPTKATSVD